MRKLRALVIVPILFVASLIGNAQAPTTLQLGTPIERAMGPGQTQEFNLTVTANTYLQLVVEQRGVDVQIKVFSPTNKSVGEFDSPNGSDGPEYISFVAAAAGSYRFSVAPLDQWDQSSGRYTIKLLEMREATEQEIKDSKYQEAAKGRGLALLLDIEETIPQVKSAQMRIRYQLQAAQLLWDTDEKRAGKFLADAITGVKESIAALDTSDQQYYNKFYAISQLRYEVVQVLASRDPDAALSFLYATAQQADPFGNRQNQLNQERTLELSIVNQLIRNDPIRALELARRSLKQGSSSSLNLTLMNLRRLKPELAVELENEIAAKLLSEKLLKNSEAVSLAISLVRSDRAPVRRVQMLPTNGAAPSPAVAPIDRFKELLQKMLTEALSFSPQSAAYMTERDAAWNLLNGLQSLGPALDTVMNGGAAAVEKRLAELNNANSPLAAVQQKFQDSIGSNPVDTVMDSITKAPPEFREGLYLQLARREANSGDLTRARQIINDHVKNLNQRRQALQNIEQQEIYRAMSKGKVEDALRGIANLRTPRERAVQVAQLASQIGQGQKRAAALNLLEQARALLGPALQAQDQDQMRALFELARAFSRYDAKRAFEIVEPLVEQFNDISAAARLLEGFGPEYYEDEELNLQNGSLATIAGQMSNTLGALALVNFDRAKATADGLRLLEVRLKVYLEIAQQTITGK